MTKRGLEFEGVEFEGVGLVEKEAVNATVHGVLKELSPIKKSRNSICNYYNGVLTYGYKQSIHLFSLYTLPLHILLLW